MMSRMRAAVMAVLAGVILVGSASPGHAGHDRVYPSGCRTRVQVWGTTSAWKDTCWVGSNYQVDGLLVRGVQSWLWGLGYSPGPNDGKWGTQTRSAVVAFQQDHAISADGIVGRGTWQKMWDRRITISCDGSDCIYRTWKHPRYHSTRASADSGRFWLDICAASSTEHVDDHWDIDDDAWGSC